MTPRLLVSAVAVLACLGLVACGDDSASPVTTAGLTTTSVVSEPTSTSTTEAGSDTTAGSSTSSGSSSTTSSTAPPRGSRPAALTTAGPSGVSIDVPEGGVASIIDEPMAFAVSAWDGRIFMQRATPDDGEGDSTPLVWSPKTEKLESIEPPLASNSQPDDSIELHDVAFVDGEVNVLYEVRPVPCGDPQSCVGAVMVWEPDTGESVEVATGNVFESGFSGLELANNGLIVGTQTSEASVGIFLDSVGSAKPPELAKLGLEEFYGDCNICPYAYSVDPSGQYIAWIDSGQDVNQDNPPDGEFNSNEIAVVNLDSDDFNQRRVGIDETSALGDLDIADIAFGDEGFEKGRAVFHKAGVDADRNPLAPVWIDLTSGTSEPIDAVSATLNELNR